MFRRLMIALGLAALIGVLLPTNPATADNNNTDFAAAMITGNVNQGLGTCEADPKKAPLQTLPSKGGELVSFTQVAMLGTFNNYVGPVTAPGAIFACSRSHLGLPPPLNALSGWGKIYAGGAFTGNEALATNKCVRGRVGAAATPAGDWAGDYVQAGVVAVVKFDISYETGNLNEDGDCVNLGKDDVNEIDCVGTIGVAPIGSLTGGPQDPVAGEIVCHSAMPSNQGAKRG